VFHRRRCRRIERRQFGKFVRVSGQVSQDVRLLQNERRPFADKPMFTIAQF
jgi:hypothetical protein